MALDLWPKQKVVGSYSRAGIHQRRYERKAEILKKKKSCVPVHQPSGVGGWGVGGWSRQPGGIIQQSRGILGAGIDFHEYEMALLLLLRE